MLDEPKGSVKDVLIVEDDDQLREVLEELLSAAGYRSIAVQDGIEALDWLSRLPIDLMIVDILMPYLDGPQLIKRVRKSKQWAVIPIIVLSGYASFDRFRDLAVDAIEAKPFDATELLEKVRQLIGPSGTASPGAVLDAGLFEG